MTMKLTSTGIVLLFAMLCLSGIAAAQEDTAATPATDDIAPYNGPVGPGSPLYGLKIALEDIDESFTANETERVEKQMNHARLRLSEVRRSLDLNESDSAELALNNYWMKMNLTNLTIARWGSNGTGLLHAQEMVVKHQIVLQNLLETHPNNTGLMRAYNNSLALEQKFENHTAIKIQRTIDRNNQTILKAIRLEQKEHNRIGWPEVNTTATTKPADDQKKGAGGNKDKGQGSGNGSPVTTTTTQVVQTPTSQQQGHGQDPGQGHGQQDQDTRPGNKATGNSGGNAGSSSGDKGNGGQKNK